MSKVHLIAATALLTVPASVRADADFRQQLTKPIVAALNSSKSPSEMQLCAADAIGEGLLPLAFPADAVGTIHIFGFGGTMGAGMVQRVVSLIKTPSGTRVVVRTRSSRPDARLINALQSCL